MKTLIGAIAAILLLWGLLALLTLIMNIIFSNPITGSLAFMAVFFVPMFYLVKNIK